MYKRVYFLLLVSVFLFTSCEDAGTTFTGVVNSPPSYSNNLSGYGCSGNTLCYPLEEIFYDLDSEVEQDYYKYNFIDIVTNDFSPDNILTLKTFGDEYLYNVPITSVYSYCDDYASESQSECCEENGGFWDDVLGCSSCNDFKCNNVSSCEDQTSLTEQDCCDNNGGVWSESWGGSCSKACSDGISISEQQCCENNGGIWFNGTCLGSCDAGLSTWSDGDGDGVDDTCIGSSCTFEGCCSNNGGEWNEINLNCNGSQQFNAGSTNWTSSSSAAWGVPGDWRELDAEICCEEFNSGDWVNDSCQNLSNNQTINDIWTVSNNQQDCCSANGGSWNNSSNLCSNSSSSIWSSSSNNWITPLGNQNVLIIDATSNTEQECCVNNGICSESSDLNQQECCESNLNNGNWNSSTHSCDNWSGNTWTPGVWDSQASSCNGNPNIYWSGESDQCILLDQDNIVSLNEEETFSLNFSSELEATSNNFSSLDYVFLDPTSFRYSFIGTSAESKTSNFLFSQDLDSTIYSTQIDTVLYNDLFGNLVLLDINEEVKRDSTVFDSLNGNALRSRRKVEYLVKESYSENLMFRSKTDCNDNYRKDDEEHVIFTKYYIDNDNNYADSFQEWCLVDACSDNSSLSESECCINNSIGCSGDPLSLTEQECCESQLNNGTWVSNSCDSWVGTSWIEAEWDGQNCTGSSANWDSQIEFNVDENNLCSTSCVKNQVTTTMDEYCWNLSLNDDRATSTCQVDISDTIIDFSEIGDSDNMQYEMAFCDRGNGIYTDEEYYFDQNNDQMWSLIGTNYEPFEDRNCNNRPDSNESLANHPGCYQVSQQNINGQTITFCDAGNGKWDNVETYYNESDCSPFCDYIDLYELSEQPNNLIVSYESGSPLHLDRLDTSFDFFDTGSDGCFDELEDGSGGCLCEFFDTDGDDDLNDVPPCDNYSANGNGEQNFSDLNNDQSITLIDIIASNRSPYDYGTCSNGFSGSEEECCLYFGCLWDDSSDTCDWSSQNPNDLNNQNFNPQDKYCSNDILVSCNIDADCDCSGQVDCSPGGVCVNDRWSINSDPNGDNCSGTCNTCDLNSLGSEGDSCFDSGEISKEYIDSSTGDIVDYNVYYSNQSAYASYASNDSEASYIITKTLDYNDGSPEGGDKVFAMLDSLRKITVITSEPIIKNKITVKSKNVLDQIVFSDNQNLSSSMSNLELVNLYSSIANEFHIMKTEYLNADNESDYDYHFYKDGDGYIVKLIHPYFHFNPDAAIPTALDENDYPPELYWQLDRLEADTVIYTYNGNLIEGQSFFSLNEMITDTAHYEIQKEYLVDRSNVQLKNSVLDPNCYEALSISECETQDAYWCDWPEFCSLSQSSCETDDDCPSGEVCEPDMAGSCSSDPINVITDCLLVTRKITTTSLGSGVQYKLISESYFKPGYKLVKQDIKIFWDALPFISTGPIQISSIEYKDPATALNVSSGGNIFGNNVIEIEDFNNIDDFNFSPFKITPTLGIQRVEVPNE